MQAISGGGYLGVPIPEILDNVIPHNSSEENMESETFKISGGITEADDRTKARQEPFANIRRVPVIDKHTECISALFERRPPTSPQLVREAMAAYTPDVRAIKCPSAPRHAIFVHEEPDRPRPRPDRALW